VEKPDLRHNRRRTSVARRSRYIGRPSMDGVYLSRIRGKLARLPSCRHNATYLYCILFPESRKP